MNISLIVKSANKNVYIYRTNFESQTIFVKDPGDFLRDRSLHFEWVFMRYIFMCGATQLPRIIILEWWEKSYIFFFIKFRKTLW